MNNEQQEPKSPDQRTLSQELALLGGRLARAWGWSRERIVRGARRATSLVRAAWNHERTLRSRRALRSGMHSGLKLLRAGMPSARRITRGVFVLGGLLVLVALSVQFVGRYCLHTVEPGSVGVRTSKWGGGGVEMKDFGPGLHLNLPGVHKWHSLSAGTKLLAWPAADALDVRTQDGTSISLSLSIPFRIQDGEAHRLVSEGSRNTFENRARAKAQQVLLSEFGKLNTEQFSESDVRAQLLVGALQKLNESLDEIHIVAERILVEGLEFSPAYEKKLVETQRERQRGRVLVARQLEDQEEQTILRRRSEIDRELLERRIELDHEIEELRVAGQALAAQKARTVEQLESESRADADRDYALAIATGEAALARANDLERRLHGEILSGPGGDEYLAVKAARAARLQEVTLDANDPRIPSPLDVSGMVELFGGTR